MGEKQRCFGSVAPSSRVEYEIGAEESISTAVVRAVSAVEGTKPDLRPTLSNVIEPAALDALFTLQEDGTPRRGGRVSFVYSDCRVSIDNGEYISLQPLDASLHTSGEPEPEERPRR